MLAVEGVIIERVFVVNTLPNVIPSQVVQLKKHLIFISR
jgi:hypothetical protein